MNDEVACDESLYYRKTWEFILEPATINLSNLTLFDNSNVVFSLPRQTIEFALTTSKETTTPI